MDNPLKSVFDGICSLSNSASFIFPYLPFIYTVVTVIFMLLGIGGIIAFAAGAKFKNQARDIYGLITFITKFISVLLLFNISYCSIDLPKPSSEVPPSTDTEPSGEHATQGGGSVRERVERLIRNFFAKINNVLENNSAPFIIINILCSSLIVILITFMSAIFSGISKAGYQIHCNESKEVINIPGLGGFIDFCMHLLLFVSFTYLVISCFWKLLQDGLVAVYNFIFSRKKKPILSAGDLLDTPLLTNDTRNTISEAVEFMNQSPVMKAAFIISMSYYISQLFLRGIEDMISNNIALFNSWKTRETECSDEPKKKSKTDIERGAVLFGNILLFIVVAIISIALVIAHIMYAPIISKGISMGLDMYIQGASTISDKLSYENIKKKLEKVSKKIPGGFDSKGLVRELEKGLNQVAPYVNSDGSLTGAAETVVTKAVLTIQDNIDNFGAPPGREDFNSMMTKKPKQEPQVYDNQGITPDQVDEYDTKASGPTAHNPEIAQSAKISQRVGRARAALDKKRSEKFGLPVNRAFEVAPVKRDSFEPVRAELPASDTEPPPPPPPPPPPHEAAIGTI